VPQPSADARLHAILLDKSLSMQQGDRWQRALDAAQSVLSTARSSDRVMLVTAGRRMDVVHPSTPATNVGALRATLRDIKPGIERFDYGMAMSTAGGWLGSPRPPVVLHFISDLQRSAAPLRFADLEPPVQTQIVMHDVGGDPAGNIYVSNAALLAADTRSVEVTIGSSIVEPQQRAVILSIDGKEYARRTVDITAASAPLRPTAPAFSGEGGGVSPPDFAGQQGAAASAAITKVLFSDVQLSPGTHRIEVVLDPADSLPQDDRFYAVVEHADPTALLVAHGANTDDAAYFAAAIGSLSAPRLNVEERAANAIDSSAGLSKYALLVIADATSLSSAAARRVHSYVAAGGAVLTTLGSDPAARNNPLLDELNVGDVQARSARVGEIATTHPVLREAGEWNRVRFFRQRAVQLGSSDKPLISLDDGTPLLIERTLGAGHMLILTAPVDRSWNDLAIHPLFVHFIAAAARYLTGRDAAATSATVGSVVMTGLTAAGGGQIFDPQGRRVLGLAQGGTDRLVPDQVGFYEIRGSEGARWLAVNVDPRESDLTALPATFVDRWQALRVREPVQSAAPAAPADNGPRSLGPWLMWLAAILLLAEVLLANRHLAIRREVPK
jgi:hypothetical protein